VKVPEEKSVNPYSLRIVGLVASAAAGSVLVCAVPCNCHPPNVVGRIGAAGGVFAAGSLAKAAAAIMQLRKTGKNRRKIMGVVKRGKVPLLLY
jgi:hypothetical protein